MEKDLEDFKVRSMRELLNAEQEEYGGFLSMQDLGAKKLSEA